MDFFNSQRKLSSGTLWAQLIREGAFILIIMMFVLSNSCKKDYSGVGKPELFTAVVSQIETNRAVTGGYNLNTNGYAIDSFGLQFGTESDFWGSVWLRGVLLEDAAFSQVITGLKYKQTYYIRAWAANELGMSFGNTVQYTHFQSGISFNPSIVYGQVSDIDGNTYKTVNIGAHEWMAENLRTTRYNDGNTIPLIVDNNAWNDPMKDMFCWYYNDPESFRPVYGALYNWWAVNSGKICPTGWHVPDTSEMIELYKDVGGTMIAGTKLKESGNSHWVAWNTADNASGFTALPGGYRSNLGSFWFEGHLGYLWTDVTRIGDSTKAYILVIAGSDPNVFGVIHSTKQSGYSLRCVMD